MEGMRSDRIDRVIVGLGKFLHNTIITALIVLGLFVAAVPFIWMAVSSLGGASRVMSVGFTWDIFNPLNWSLKPYIFAWRIAGLNRYVGNTVKYAVLVTLLSTLAASLAGYVFGRLRFPGRDLLFGLTLSSMMIPGSVTMIPLFAIILRVPLVGGNDILGRGGQGLYNSLAGMVLPAIASANAIFLFRQFFQTLPKDLEDAARIDGCNEMGIWWRVILPLSGPVITVVALFAIMSSWNEFLWPLIISSSENLYTLQVGLYSLSYGSGSFVSDPELFQSVLLAGAVVSVLPVLALFIAFQRKFVQGIALTGIK